MGQVAINVNGRSYRFNCGDGEESRLQELAAYVRGRIEALAHQHGNAGGERLLLMAALLITDELLDARAAATAALAATAAAASTATTATTAATARAEKPPVNGAARPLASADRREQEAIRTAHQRRMAAGDV
jgi:cell division protein ZapA